MAGASVTVRVDSAQVRAFLTSPSGPLWRDIQRRGNRVLTAAKNGCPVDQGTARASLTMEMSADERGLPQAKIGSALPYIIFIHEGTGVYAGRGYIYPKHGRFLRWPARNNSGSGRRRYKGGTTARYAYARRVKGVPARPFLRDALRAAR